MSRSNTANLSVVDTWSLTRPLKYPEIGKLPYPRKPGSLEIPISDPEYRAWLTSKAEVLKLSVDEKGCSTRVLSLAEREFYAKWGFIPSSEQLRMVGVELK